MVGERIIADYVRARQRTTQRDEPAGPVEETCMPDYRRDAAVGGPGTFHAVSS